MDKNERITERLRELTGKIELGMIKKLAQHSRVYGKNREYKPRQGNGKNRSVPLFTADLRYRMWYSRLPGARSIEVLEFFDPPNNMVAWEYRKNVFLHLSRRKLIIQHWNWETFKGRANPRREYLIHRLGKRAYEYNTNDKWTWRAGLRRRQDERESS